MHFSLSRALRLSLPILAGLQLLATPLAAKPKPAPAPPLSAPAMDTVPWLYKGSDIPVDKAWTFGVLPNGVRYAVRRNGVPPGQVSIRIGMDVGSLYESDSEQGYAHFIEHLSFRGSAYLSDGEAKRVWQRLGASFGSDTNANTGNTQTAYKIDLPDATEAGLDESLKILSGMMAGATITPAEVDAERRTILAELREQSGPQTRVFDATRALYFAGQLLGSRSPIGTVATLNAATSESLRAFHARWYRPDKAIVVIAGDGDPAQYEALIKKYFSAWKAKGSITPDPVFGDPDPKAKASAIITEPGVPMSVGMAILRPWRQRNDTIIYNQGKLTDIVAMRLINRRLEKSARAGASYLQASVDQEDISRSVDGTFVTVQPIGSDWQKALNDVRSVIADAMQSPSSQEEIDREAGEFLSALQVGVETERTEAAAKQADDILQAVDIRETVATAQVAYDVFGGIRGKITPEVILASTRKLFAGTPPRVLLTTASPIADGEAKLAAALAAAVTAKGPAQAQAAVRFDQLPKLGAPGTVVAQKALAGLGMEQVDFSNGAKAILFLNPAETGKIYVQVRFGGGRTAFAPDKPNLAWAGPSMLVSSGVGPFNEDALDRLTSGRVIGLGFDIGENAFVLSATTRAADLADQLTLMAQQLANPRWDPAPVLRSKAGLLLSYDTINTTAQSVMGREAGGFLRGGDRRWTTPTRAELQALTPAAFRQQWEPLLKQGPLEILIFGDAQREDAVAAIAASLGALPKRAAFVAAKPSLGSKGPTPTPKPVVAYHKGPADQAAAMIAWPTAGGLSDVYESRKLELLSAIFNDRMFDRFREAEGQSYSPNVSSNWPMGLTSGGSFVVSAQLKPEGMDRFFALTQEIAADFAAKPPGADEFARASGPIQESLSRASSGNRFWMSMMAGATQDPRRIDALKSLPGDFRRITPAEIQETAKRWLIPAKAAMLAVKPQPKPVSAAR